MNILVYDIAASNGGGVTILKQYIEKAKRDKSNSWFFIVSIAGMEELGTDNVHILYQRMLDKTGVLRWIARLLFEQTRLKSIIRTIQPDKALSLQNMTVPWVKCHQTVYLHQSLQFAPVKFSFFRKHERSCAFRQKVICRMIRNNLHRADEIIVQTEWMKKATIKWLGIAENRVQIETPFFETNVNTVNCSLANNAFFYPADGSVYKNHDVIVEACKILKNQQIIDFDVEFTISSEDNSHTKDIDKKIRENNLPISLIGYQKQKLVYQKYTTKVLLFPSYIETFGLPLLEAREHRARIIVSDCAYSREVLSGYKNCKFVPWDDAYAWAKAMQELVMDQTVQDKFVDSYKANQYIE